MKTIIKSLFPFIEHEEFIEDQSYMILFSATLFIITSFFSYQLIKLYTPELYVGVDHAFPIGILSIFTLLFLSTLYFVLFILIPFTLNIINFITLISTRQVHDYTVKLVPTVSFKTDSPFRSKFRGPLSTVMTC